MANKSWKIVDGFNGGEDERRFDDEGAAHVAMEADLVAFLDANVGCTLSSFRRVVVMSDAEWFWDQRTNRWAWG